VVRVCVVFFVCLLWVSAAAAVVHTRARTHTHTHTHIPTESEIREIRGAVAGLKSALDGMRTNTDASAAGMLRLTLRESRDQLARRLAEVSPATATDPSVAAATREAGILLEEVDAMFYAS
jgi:hypothetical protein